jgi:uncharacterized protein YjcR
MTRRLADTQAIAHMTGVAPGTVRSWASRHKDKLPRRGHDQRGRTLYDIAEAQDLAAELAKSLPARNTERTSGSMPGSRSRPGRPAPASP